MGNNLYYSPSGKVLTGSDPDISGEVVIPGGINEIGHYAFTGRTQLTSIFIPDGVERIKMNAFYECKNLQKVSLPASLKEIDFDAFLSCGKPKTVEYRGNPFAGSLEDWCNIKFASITSNPCYPDGKLLFNGAETPFLNIKKTAKAIGKFAFAGCNSIRRVVMEDGIETIGTGAFSHCRNLQNVRIPDTVTEIGANAFYACGLKEICIPGSVKAIESATFTYCSALKTAEFKTGVESIENMAFYGCSFLKHVFLPSGLLYIGDQAFSNCPHISSMYVPGTVDVIGNAIALRGDDLQLEDSFEFYCESDQKPGWDNTWNKRNPASRTKRAATSYNVPRWWYNKYVLNNAYLSGV